MNHRTRIKICGLREPAHARLAAEAGADAIGLVFYGRSPRHVQAEAAADVAAALPPYVMAVGLFVDAPAAEIDATLARVPLDLLQFHGSEPPDHCRSFGRRYMKAIAMGDDADFTARARSYGDAAALLLDAHASGGQGGTGVAFDWRRVPRDWPQPIVLAGGLGPDNVATAIAAAAPYAVDVSSGIEQRPGVKDSGKMARFIDEVRRAG